MTIQGPLAPRSHEEKCMHIVTDGGMDISPEQREGLRIHIVPLIVHLDGEEYRSGIDLNPEGFYRLLSSTDSLPSTSTPSPGVFAELYQELAREDPEILSIHLSSGLSGTLNAAQQGAKMVPEAKVTFFDTMTLSGAQGWLVEAAARAARAGWPVDRTLGLLEQIRSQADTIYTLPDLKYLINGGRISHLKGLLASVLKIKPLIGVSKEDGKYYERGKQRSFGRALAHIVDIIAKDHPAGTPLRVQIAHANNPEGAEQLRQLLERHFPIEWLPSCSIAPCLGAHTGPGLVGAAFAPIRQLPAVP